MLLVHLRGAGSTDHPSGRTVSNTDRAGGFGGFQSHFPLRFRSYPFISLHRKENPFHAQRVQGQAGRCRPAELRFDPLRGEGSRQAGGLWR